MFPKWGEKTLKSVHFSCLPLMCVAIFSILAVPLADIFGHYDTYLQFIGTLL